MQKLLKAVFYTVFALQRSTTAILTERFTVLLRSCTKSPITRFISFLCIVVLLPSCKIPNKISEHQEFVQKTVYGSPSVESHYLAFDDLRLHYLQAGHAKDGIVVWIHGTPGSAGDLGALFLDEAFTSNILLVAPDRPGWKASQPLPESQPVTGSHRSKHSTLFPDFSDQERYLGGLIRKLRTQHPDVPIILAGHSWGASVSLYIALKNQQTIDGLMLLAGGLDPKLTKPRWYNKAASTLVVKAALPQMLRDANVEVYALHDQLKALEPRWSELDIPVMVLQGDKDRLVNPKNAIFAASQLKKAERSQYKVLMLKAQGHLLQMERLGLIAKCAKAMVANQLEQCKE